jgi:hypothetical protein
MSIWFLYAAAALVVPTLLALFLRRSAVRRWAMWGLYLAVCLVGLLAGVMAMVATRSVAPVWGSLAAMFALWVVIVDKELV